MIVSPNLAVQIETLEVFSRFARVGVRASQRGAPLVPEVPALTELVGDRLGDLLHAEVGFEVGNVVLRLLRLERVLVFGDRARNREIDLVGAVGNRRFTVATSRE